MIKSKSILKKKRGKTMKKFTKIMLSVAAVTAVSTAMAISAMAEDTVTGTYASETGVVTLDGVVSSGDQQTLLVLTEDADTVTEGIIAQIDQDAAISQFVLPANIESGTYYIRIGGTDGTIQTGTLTIGGGSEPGGETVTLTIGDVNGDNEVGAGDGLFVARYNAKYTTNIGSIGTQYEKTGNSGTYTVGDVNGDNEVGAGDGLFIARYNAKYTTNIGSVGQTVDVVAAE
jgi:hypothetical protein